MMTDAELAALLREALPPVDDSPPAGDLWARVVARTAAPPAWSWLDLGMAAGVVAALIARPDWIVMIAYHL